MSLVDIRKYKLDVEESWHEGGPRLNTPLRVVVSSAIVKNPFAGRYEPDLMPFMAELRKLGMELATRAVSALGGAQAVQAYGKAALVGEDGELEHGAVWHEAGGWAMRELLGEPKAIVPSAKSIGTLGTRLIIPLSHLHAAYVRSHFGAAEMTIWDGPRRNEIVFGLAMATGGRIHARVGGLAEKDVVGNDGLR